MNSTAEQHTLIKRLMYERLMMEPDEIAKTPFDRMTWEDAASLIKDYNDLPELRREHDTHQHVNFGVQTTTGTTTNIWPVSASPLAQPAPTAHVVQPPAPGTVPGVRSWDCYTCHQVFPTWPELAAHKQLVHGVTPKPAATPPPVHAPTSTPTFGGYTSSIPSIASHASTGTTWLPVGRYAVEVDGVWKFYRVTERESRYAKGKKFHWLVRQAGDRFVGVTQPERLKVEFLANSNIQEAMQRYGREMGMCGCCGRSLTDPDSIAFGIGPDCRAQRGWV